MQEQIRWDDTAKRDFESMMSRIPVFLRPVAQSRVSQRAENLAKNNNRLRVSQKDMVDAFFTETPFGFHGPMKADMKDIGIDYVQYGYDA